MSLSAPTVRDGAETSPPIREATLVTLRASDLHTSADKVDHPRFTHGWRRGLTFIGWMRLLVLALPMAGAILYLGFIAADRYVSDAHFLLRGAAGDVRGALGGLQPGGLVRASDDTHALRDWLLSRDAMEELIKAGELPAVLARPEADFVNRFPGPFSSGTKEALFRRYGAMVDVSIDEASSVLSLQVTTFRAADSQRIAAALLAHAEQFLNNLNRRAEQDALAYAKAYVEESRARVVGLERELTSFRNSSGSIDPVREAAARVEAMAGMSSDLARGQASLSTSRFLTPDAPSLTTTAGALLASRAELQREAAAIAGSDGALSENVATYERLSLERDIATKGLAQALTFSEKAREESLRQHLYLQMLAAPSRPDEPAQPRRLLWLVGVLMICACSYLILRSLHTITMEHSI